MAGKQKFISLPRKEEKLFTCWRGKEMTSYISAGVGSSPCYHFFYVVGISVCKKTALLSSLNSNSLVLFVYFVSLDAWLRGILIFSSWLGCTKWDVQIEIYQRPLFVSQTFRAAGWGNWLLSDRFWVQFRRDSNMIRSYYIPARIDHYNISAKY